MKDLVFSICFGNHNFIIRTSPRSKRCYYSNEGKYTTSLIFASNTYATVKYKNVYFHGTVTKSNNWYVKVECQTILRKRYDRYYLLTDDSMQRKENNDVINNVVTEYPGKIMWLYNQLIEELSEYYRCIEDKETFKTQICEVLVDNYWDEENGDLDQIVEYENENDLNSNEDPIYEKTSLRETLTAEFRGYCICFRQAEIDNKNKKMIISLENIIHETPGLLQMPYELLQKQFDRFCEEDDAEIMQTSIWYSRKETVANIGEKILKSCKYELFINTVEKRIDKILSAMVIEGIDKGEMYLHFKWLYDEDYLPSDEEFELRVKQYVSEYLEFNKTYEKFVSLFQSNHIQIEWNGEKLRLFQRYDEEGWVSNPCDLAEYEAYKYVIPFYRRHFFRKNSNRYKPTIEKLPTFISYASTVLDILFKHKILINNGDGVIYNHNGEFELVYEDLASLPDY